MLKTGPAMALKSQNKTQNKSKKSLILIAKIQKKENGRCRPFSFVLQNNQSILSAKECVDVGLHFTLSALLDIVKIPQAQVDK